MSAQGSVGRVSGKRARPVGRAFGAVCTLLLLALSLGVSACGGSDQDIIIKTADGAKLTAADIDRDPIALLPPGAVGWVFTDARAQFNSAFGQRLLQVLQSRLPVPPSAHFVPERDLERTYLGLYSMQGVDFAGVAVGTFDPAAIEQAASGLADTPLGGPLVKSQYAGRNLYVAANVGFVVLTGRTVLYGNETGIRRALDRIDRGELSHRVEPWAETVLAQAGTSVAAAIDFTADPTVANATRGVPFAEGITRAAIAGNFVQPGMQISAVLSYPDADAAARGAARVQTINNQLQSLSFLASLAGMSNPIVGLTAQPQGPQVRLAFGLDAAGVGKLIEQVASWLGAPPATVQAQTTPITQ